jgi:hypothetical protein
MVEIIVQRFERSQFAFDLQVEESSVGGGLASGSLPYIEMTYPKPQGFKHLTVVKSEIRLATGYSNTAVNELGIYSTCTSETDTHFSVRFIFPNTVATELPVIGWFESAFYRN